MTYYKRTTSKNFLEENVNSFSRFDNQTRDFPAGSYITGPSTQSDVTCYLITFIITGFVFIIMIRRDLEKNNSNIVSNIGKYLNSYFVIC